MWLATDGHALVSAWKDDDDNDDEEEASAAAARRWRKSAGRQRRSGGGRNVDPQDYMDDYEQNVRRQHRGNPRSPPPHRRPPVDPTLLMMGIGKRK